MAPVPMTSRNLLFRDESLVVLNKPAGIPMHPSRILAGQPDTLLAQARELAGHWVFLVHRLDRPVSGAVVMAADRETQALLGHQFEERTVKKCYLAVVRGWQESTGKISHALLPPRDDRKPGSIAREAITGFETIAQAELNIPIGPYQTARYSLLALFPETGRRHQLRRHMKHISHPMIGDTSYGRGEHNRLFREHFNCSRLLLHSWDVSFEHPGNGQTLCVHAPLDDDFQSIIDRFGWGTVLTSWNRERRQMMAG